MEEGESIQDAVIREAQEETGLTSLTIRSYLGVREYDMSEYASLLGGKIENHRRHYYHLELLGDAPETWRHYEWDRSGSRTVPFDFFWAKMPDEVPELIAWQGDLLSSVQV